MSTFERLREERERLGLSQEKFGALGGVLKRAQINYEKGERNPDSAYLSAIAAAGVDVLYVLTGQRSGSVPAPTLTADEREMLALFRSATLTGKAAAIGALQGAAGIHAPKIHIAGGAHGQIADVIHNTTTRAPARARRS